MSFKATPAALRSIVLEQSKKILGLFLPYGIEDC
jgi:hypothetical protein